jgi:bifunctional DNA-binding transcriptional regulator/antitoxin component of YhaV-PrlF toxin-antitoxin module
MPNVVGERFQVTIDKKVRAELDVRPGDQAFEWVEEGRLVIRFLRPGGSMLGILKKLTNTPIEPITDWQAVKERAWNARAAEIMDALEADNRRHRPRDEDRGAK